MTFNQLNGAAPSFAAKKNQTTSAAATPVQTPRTSMSESRPSASKPPTSAAQKQLALHELMNQAVVGGRGGYYLI
ncbi:hypothetical protein BGZ94_008989 [Podila epigama]|nr:hypothetical protein BGZ94_008989 [Podila epigama]